MVGIKLKEFQEKCVEELLEQTVFGEKKEILLQAPTGSGKTIMLLADKNENIQKSARNIEGVKTTLVNTINVYDLLKYKNLVITLDTVKKLEEVYA